MRIKNTYISLVLFHVFLGILLYQFSFLGKLISVLLFFVGLYVINIKRDKNFEALNFSAYVVGIEILLRMTGGNIFNEYAKYVVMIFLFLGILHRGFSKKALVYVFFILLFIPGIYIGIKNLNLDANIRKAIAFNLSGPICLAVSAIYCFDKKIYFNQIRNLFVSIGLPIVSILAYIYIYTPSVKDAVTGTQSNFETSGGFGPNQISTILGLGMFVFFVLFLLFSKTNKKILILNIVIVLLMAFRAIVTFSRGGVSTGVVCILALILLLYLRTNSSIKLQLQKIIFFSLVLGVFVWGYSLYQTNGLIQNRYENKDARGRLKEDRLGGREKLVITELNMFLDNPLLGVGIGKNKEYREEMTGIVAASHNEISRMLAEQGLFGILGLLILLLIPMLHFLENREHIFLFSFFLFWLFTINHAAMRIAAPAFIYALSLLKVTFDEEPTLHRE